MTISPVCHVTCSTIRIDTDQTNLVSGKVVERGRTVSDKAAPIVSKLPEAHDAGHKSPKTDERPPLLAEVHGQRDAEIKMPSFKPADLSNEISIGKLMDKGHLPDFSLIQPKKIEPVQDTPATAAPAAHDRKPDAKPDGKPDAHPSRPTSPSESTSERVRELHGLAHSAHDGNGADAVVVIPPNFDPKKPVNLMIYNHGWYDTASSSLHNAKLAEQMKNAPPNTVLIVPEWQKTPGSSGKGASNQGTFGNENFVSGMVQDVLNKTPELKGKTLADINHVGIISHSAGYVPTESELYKNPELAKKVNSVTMLDSLYDGHGLDKWLHQNIGALSDGTKQYHNIFNESTAANSRAQAQFVARELQKYGGSNSRNSEQIDYSGRPLSATQLEAHPIVFKSTSMPHMEIPKNYVATVEEAADRRTTALTSR